MVLHICFISFDNEVVAIRGLTEVDFWQRINEASNERIEVSFILRKHKNKEKKSTANVKIFLLEKIEWVPLPLSYFVHCINSFFILMKEKSDIYIANEIFTPGLIIFLVSKLLNKRSMITIHGFFDKECKLCYNIHLQGKKSYILRSIYYKIFEKIAMKKINLFVVNDSRLKEKLINKGVNPSRILVRYVFVDTKKFSRENIDNQKLRQIKSIYKLPKKYILYVGRLNKWEGAEDMLKVFKKIHSELPQIKCVILGKGMMKPQIESYIKKNNFDDFLIQIDEIDYDIMPYFYYGAEVVLLPSHSPQAGVGRITIEALSMEVPVIVTDIGEFHKVIIDGKSGYRVQEGNTDLMGSITISLLKNPELINSMGKNGREIVKSGYDREMYINNWIESLEYIVGHPLKK